MINLSREVGFFITMNPGYAGRQELPENLKSLFRGVTMMVPDREIIMKVKLTACGYRDNVLLAKKFNVLYRLCEEQLSKQAHYDFGLRNILGVLRTAGKSKRDNLDAQEMLLLMRTLRDMNLSKFVAEDVPLFLSLISDLFPGISAGKAEWPWLEGRSSRRWARSACSRTAVARQGDRAVGDVPRAPLAHARRPVGCRQDAHPRGADGLAERLHAVERSAAARGREPPRATDEPKAITAPQMFGSLDVVANEWTEGIFAQLWRKANKDKKSFTWLVLDGPVDAIWIENMNTVMDDNRYVRTMLRPPHSPWPALVKPPCAAPLPPLLP